MEWNLDEKEEVISLLINKVNLLKKNYLKINNIHFIHNKYFR